MGERRSIAEPTVEAVAEPEARHSADKAPNRWRRAALIALFVFLGVGVGVGIGFLVTEVIFAEDTATSIPPGTAAVSAGVLTTTTSNPITTTTFVDDDGFGEVVVDGTPLPIFDLASSFDPSIGVQAPTVTGEDATGAKVTIGPDGRAKIVVLVAHWCPQCQDQLSVLESWGGSGALPDGVDLYALAVLTDRLLAEGTWPPGEWLEAEGWDYPSILDDADGRAATAFGVGPIPYFIVLDGDNNVLGRVSGQLDAGQLDALALSASEDASTEGTVPGDLGLQKPMARPDCDGSYVTFIGASVNPDRYAEEIAAYLADYPDADYLRSSVTCGSLRPATESGDAIYAVFFGPFATFEEACQARAQGPPGSYVKPLDNFSDPEQIPAC